MTFDEIMAELGLTDEEAKNLYKNLTLKHGLSGAEEDFTNFDDKELKTYAQGVVDQYKTRGITITVDEVLKGIQNMLKSQQFSVQIL